MHSEQHKSADSNMASGKYQNRKTGLRRLLYATINSAKGLFWMFRHEAAFRQELLVSMVLVPVAFMVTDSVFKQLALVVSLLVVMLVEILNTAIEAVVDRISTEHHPMSGLAKDLGSAAVSVAILVAVLIWSVVLFTSARGSVL